jgi:hypothetical protein
MVAGVIGAVILLVLTVAVVIGFGSSGGSDDAAKAGQTSTGSTSGAPTTPSGGSSSAPSSPAASTTATSTAAASGAASTGTPAGGGLAPCVATQLTVSAGSQAPSYKVGDQPVLVLQVLNNGPANCTQDLADTQVELRVYNGAARVWGSHDCQIEPGTSVKTLVAGTPVGVQVTWSGLSSQPACAGTRQRVGAGTYTVYPYLAGAQGVVAQFSIS